MLPNSEPRLLSLPNVLERVGLGKTKLYDMISHGQFPAPRKVGRRSLWPSTEVSVWIQRVIDT